jgi:serine/threonine-protein kinase
VFLAICAALVLGSLFGAAWILLLQPGGSKSSTEAAASGPASADAKPTGVGTESAASGKPAETAVPSLASSSAAPPTSKTGRVPVTPKTATVKTAEEVDPGTGTGTLQVAVNPWGTVSVDGRSYGTTPLGAISLPVGTHTVVVTNPELGASRSASVKITSGKTSAIRFDLKKSE